MTLEGRGYAGRCRFAYRENSTGVKASKVIARKMSEEEMLKYGVTTNSNDNADNSSFRKNME